MLKIKCVSHQLGTIFESTFETVDKQLITFQALPNFGEYLETRKETIAKIKEKEELAQKFEEIKRIDEKIQVPKIKDIIGAGLPHIGTYKNLDNKKQVVALINDVSEVK